MRSFCIIQRRTTSPLTFLRNPGIPQELLGTSVARLLGPGTSTGAPQHTSDQGSTIRHCRHVHEGRHDRTRTVTARLQPSREVVAVRHAASEVTGTRTPTPTCPS